MSKKALFIRLLKERDKADSMQLAVRSYRVGEFDSNMFEVEPEDFQQVPGTPFAYWVPEKMLKVFNSFPTFEGQTRTGKVGLQTSDDFRFLRAWWEIGSQSSGTKWFPFAKGGAFSPYYSDLNLVINWARDGAELKAWAGSLYNNSHWSRIIKNVEWYFRPGVTWPTRTQKFGPRVLPKGGIFAHKGCSAFNISSSATDDLAMLGIMLSRPFRAFVEMRLNAADATARSFEAGIIQSTPFPLEIDNDKIATIVYKAWSLKRTLDTVTETSHAFLLPEALRMRLDSYEPSSIETELKLIQTEIDTAVFELYGFSEADRAVISQANGGADEDEGVDLENEDDSSDGVSSDGQNSLIAWCVGVAFGRFDWRLASGERLPPPEPEPFDSLPAKSPGMLPDGVELYDDNGGILVDDPGHPHDLARLVESVLERVDVPVPPGVRLWIQRDFFKEHLKHYSKSRRKAPIYWPLTTASGSFTLWIYYPTLTGQTLYTAVNDFVEPKIKSVEKTAQFLRNKTNRSQVEERELEQLQDFELELTDLRDTLLQIAKDYAPNHDDGVQISAAPLWPLFRHKTWQKVLKDTWKQLEKGDYDWAHLAMNYWPDRVRDKCKMDQSLAIAHGLEDLYKELPEQPKKKR